MTNLSKILLVIIITCIAGVLAYFAYSAIEGNKERNLGERFTYEDMICYYENNWDEVHYIPQEVHECYDRLNNGIDTPFKHYLLLHAPDNLRSRG